MSLKEERLSVFLDEVSTSPWRPEPDVSDERRGKGERVDGTGVASGTLGLELDD